MDNWEYIKELFRVVSVDSILVIDRRGKLRSVYCPFRAIFVIPVGVYYKGAVVLVEAIKMTEDLRDVFIVEGKAYYLIYFQVLLDDP